MDIPTGSDFQTLLNFGGGGALTALGWFARELWTAVNQLRGDLSTLREEMAKQYVSKDDFRGEIREVKELLQRIDNKLDRKVDKP